jgi:hypothetical protein
MMQLLRQVDRIVAEVTAWDGISPAPHRYGGTEFRLGTREVGHLHLGGMLDIPFQKAVRDALIADGRAEPHHLLHDTGWTSYYIRSERDAAGALWLLRLAYLLILRRPSRRGQGGLTPAQIEDALTDLNPGPALAAVLLPAGVEALALAEG